MNCVELETDCGTVRGLENESCFEFRGIRYATAERFGLPTPVTHWDGVYDATAFRACALQHRAFEDDATVNAFYHKEFRKGLSFTYSEDCLFLNIRTPKAAENCPVILYIHGGSFTGGSADEGQIAAGAGVPALLGFIGYDGALAVQTPEVTDKLYTAATLVLTVILLGMFLLLTFAYKLSKSELQKLREQLEASQTKA